jgi:hypothetical protein
MQLEDRLSRRFAQQVPDRDIDRGNRGHADALAAPGKRATIHLFPQMGIVPGVFADHQRRHVQIDRVLDQAGRQRRVADADLPVIGFDFADQPFVETERPHRVAAGVERVRRVGAKIRLRRYGLTGPLENPGAD